jgi:hypothetical protein
MPAPQRNASPDCLDQPERPGPLQKAVDRAKRASRRESENEPVAALLQSVSHQHRGHREQTEQAQYIHLHPAFVPPCETLCHIFVTMQFAQRIFRAAAFERNANIERRIFWPPRTTTLV